MSKLPIAGNVARGDDFFGRERELDDLWRALESEPVLLLAPRRVGKTSLMTRLEADATTRSFTAIRDSVEGCTSELEFVTQLYRAAVRVEGSFLQRVSEHTAVGRLRKWFPKEVGVGPLELTFVPEAAADWRELGATFAEILKGIEGRRVLVMIDELPLFVLKLAETSEELARSWSGFGRYASKYRKFDGYSRARSGSMGLPNRCGYQRRSTT